MRATPSVGQLDGARFHCGAPLGGHLVERELAGGHAFGRLLSVLAGAHHEVDEGPHDAARQQLAGVLDDDVDERHVDLVHAGDAQQAQCGPLGGVGGVLVDMALDVVGDGVGGRASARDERLVQLDRVVHCHTVLGVGEGTSSSSRRRRTGRHGREAVDDVEDGRAVADCVGDRAEEDPGVVRLREAVGVGGHGQHPQRREHAHVDPAAAQPAPSRREDEDRGVAHDEGELAPRRQGAEKSSANSCVSAPPTNSTFVARRSTSRATRTPSPTMVSRSSVVSRPRSSTATARALESVSGVDEAAGRRVDLGQGQHLERGQCGLRRSRRACRRPGHRSP